MPGLWLSIDHWPALYTAIATRQNAPANKNSLLIVTNRCRKPGDGRDKVFSDSVAIGSYELVEVMTVFTAVRRTAISRDHQLFPST